jgi:GTP-binding protein
MFVDTAKVTVTAGRGGDGSVSFRREIYIDKGGPDGGDGGRGGNVIFEASTGENTLLDFRYQPNLTAKNGEQGSKKNMHGRNGDDLIVKVPVGTVVKHDGQIVADLTKNGEQVIVAKGGDGGFGNAHFKSSIRQTPRLAELGEPGDTFEAELELKLLADVGLVGFPNAGKSTFLSVVSNARPEIADYAFTTLTPNLGVAKVDDASLLIADIPGLIEGASEGKGLGDNFLRHVERTGVLLHLIDIYSDDVAESYRTIRDELHKYNPALAERPEVIALTKAEGLDADIVAMQKDALQKVAGKDARIFVISSQAHKGITEVLRALRVKVDEFRVVEARIDDEVEGTELETITLGKEQLSDKWDAFYDTDTEAWVVTGEKIEKFARRTNFDQFESVNRLRDIMKKMGIYHHLVREGATGESTVQIGDTTFTLLEQ